MVGSLVRWNAWRNAGETQKTTRALNWQRMGELTRIAYCAHRYAHVASIDITFPVCLPPGVPRALPCICPCVLLYAAIAFTVGSLYVFACTLYQELPCTFPHTCTVHYLRFLWVLRGVPPRVHVYIIHVHVR